PPRSTLSPYTTLFRSRARNQSDRDRSHDGILFPVRPRGCNPLPAERGFGQPLHAHVEREQSALSRSACFGLLRGAGHIEGVEIVAAEAAAGRIGHRQLDM